MKCAVHWQARIQIAQTAQTIHPSNRLFYEFRVMLHAYSRDAYAKYMNGNRPKDSNLFHSLTCKNSAIFDYDGISLTYMVSLPGVT